MERPAFLRPVRGVLRPADAAAVSSVCAPGIQLLFHSCQDLGMTLSAGTRLSFLGAVELFDSRVASVSSDAWLSPSPCEGWTARDVVAHVVTNLRALRAAVAGEDFFAVFGQLVVEGDIVSAWSEQRSEASLLVEEVETVESINVGGNPVSRDMMLDGLMRDLVIHTWDVARAVGGDERLPADLVAAATAAMVAVGPELRGPGLYGAEIAAPSGATPLASLLALSGRNPH